MRPKPTADEVRELRTSSELGMDKCKEILQRQWRHDVLDDIRNKAGWDDPRQTIKELLDLIEEIPGF